MIQGLSIRNLAVAETVDVTFEKGLNVLTGETGAGKSIVVDAISLALGARGSADFVRHGEKKAEITALFELPAEHPVWGVLSQLGLMEDRGRDGSILIKRDISHTGKSTCRLNGQLITLSMLKQIGETLVDIHGQHDHQSLLREDEHLDWLDAYAREALAEVKEQYKYLYREYRRIEQEIRALSEDERETAQRIDLLQFQLKEIREAELNPGEEEELENRRHKLSYREKLNQLLQEAYGLLEGEQGALRLVGRIMSAVDTALQYDRELKNVAELVETAYYQIEEASRELGNRVWDDSFDPEELNAIEARLHVIEQLKRKYAPTVAEIVAYGNKIEKELYALKHRESHLAELERSLGELAKQMETRAARLTDIRKKAALRLQREVELELKSLHMPNARFRIEFQETGTFTEKGCDQVRFAISTNPGEPVKSLVKVASGGELSRLMLALKTVFYRVDEVTTLVFDEIDTGVSGRTAQAIAEKMYRIAGKRQVLCVTHLPQVACMADRHFLIAKDVVDKSTVTRVIPLSGDRRVNELARILGGVEVTHKTKQHAAEMLRLAEQRKQK